jgi:L-lysine 2,3-aminomutase
MTGEAIEKSLALAYTNVPPVRIVQAFSKFIEFLSERYSIVLHINNKGSIDSVSSEIIEYLAEANIPGFHLE